MLLALEDNQGQTTTNSLTNNPSTSAKIDSEDENLQLQILHETYSSAKKQTRNDSVFDLSFFNRTSRLTEFFLLLDIPLKVDTTIEFQKQELC